MTTRSGVTPDDKKRIEKLRGIIRIINPKIENNDAAFLLTQLDEAHEALREMLETFDKKDDFKYGEREALLAARKALGEE